MLPATLQFLITMIACAINERMQRKLDYTQEDTQSVPTANPRTPTRLVMDTLFILRQHPASATCAPARSCLSIVVSKRFFKRRRTLTDCGSAAMTACAQRA